MNAKEDLVEKNNASASREERFNDETEASASRRRRRRTTRFSVASRAKNRIGLVDGFGRQNSSSVSSLTSLTSLTSSSSTSSRRRKRRKTLKKRSKMFFFCLVVLMTCFGKEVQGKYPVARFSFNTSTSYTSSRISVTLTWYGWIYFAWSGNRARSLKSARPNVLDRLLSSPSPSRKSCFNSGSFSLDSFI